MSWLEPFLPETSRVIPFSFVTVCFLVATAFWAESTVSFVNGYGKSSITFSCGMRGILVVLGLGEYAEFTPEEVLIVLLPLLSTLVQLVVMVFGRGDETVYLGDREESCYDCDHCDHKERNWTLKGHRETDSELRTPP